MIVFDQQLSDERIKSHIIQLYQLAKIDELLKQEEKDFLYHLGRKNGIDEATVDRYLEEARDQEIVLPKDRKERLIQLYDYVSMMLVDGKLDDREAIMCSAMAEKLGFNKALVNSLTKAIVTADQDNQIPQLSEEELNRSINNPDSL